MDHYYSLYGLLALSHLGIQMILAHRDHQNQKGQLDLCTLMSVGIVIPVYNENPEILRGCILSALATRCSDKTVVVVDDGSTNIDSLNDVYAEVREAGAIVIKITENVGKRAVQKVGFDLLQTKDIIVTIDSDTTIDPEGIQEILMPFLDKKVGAVTGHVMVSNESKNLLTKLISCRYWNAFNQERAAQSVFGVVTCCSGPFSAYRKEIIEKVKDDYISQKFLGTPCTFGDDRHLTNLVLREGYQVKYKESAKSYTQVPEQLNQYLKQQVRWGRSFFREMIWTFKTIKKHHFYMTYDMIMQIILPFMLVAALGGAILQSFIYPLAIVQYLAFVVGISLLRSLYGLNRTKKGIFLTFTLYGLIYILAIVPVKLYALSTMTTKRWGTR